MAQEEKTEEAVTKPQAVRGHAQYLDNVQRHSTLEHGHQVTKPQAVRGHAQFLHST